MALKYGYVEVMDIEGAVAGGTLEDCFGVAVHTSLYLALKVLSVDISLLCHVALKVRHREVLIVLHGIRKYALEHFLVLGGDSRRGDVLKVDVASSVTYCRIHLARGRAVSLEVEEVVRRVQQLEEAGQQEVVLTGVNLSQYRGLYHGPNGAEYLNLAGLLQELLNKSHSIRIRISSLYPESVDENLCAVISHQRIQPYFHLSIQSGSDAILKAMRRPYRSAQVYRAVELLRQAKNNPFIACDIIAGFPGETEEDFALTQAMCQSCNFAWVHAFPFSPRPGTPAATMKGQVTQSVAGQRVKWLTSFAIQSKCSYISMWKGQVVSAITEHNRQDRKNSIQLHHGTEGHGEGGMEVQFNNGNKQCTHAVTENFIHLELPGAFPQGVSIRVRIGEPLLERIRAGDECEASGEAVEDGVQEKKMESTP